MYEILLETADGKFITFDMAHTEKDAAAKVAQLRAKRRNAKFIDRDAKKPQREERGRGRRRHDDDDDFGYGE